MAENTLPESRHDMTFYGYGTVCLAGVKGDLKVVSHEVPLRSDAKKLAAGVSQAAVEKAFAKWSKGHGRERFEAALAVALQDDVERGPST